MAIFGRKIGAAHERFQPRSQPHAHGPPPTAGCSLDKCHINPINIRTFLAIDLDVDKVAIHQRGCGRVFERLVRHDVTPMASGVADGEEDRLIFASGPEKRFFAPGIPIDGVLRMLQEVGRLLVSEIIPPSRGLDLGGWFEHETPYRVPFLPSMRYNGFLECLSGYFTRNSTFGADAGDHGLARNSDWTIISRCVRRRIKN